ncbi:Wnt inhibitory factor 1 [Homalodisca vitripennis]|nr:Wnt inhibitory factor 1 [Homalodisca vitripennis]
MWKCYLVLACAVLTLTLSARNNGNGGDGDLSLWIDEQQVKMFSGFAMEIYAIVDGKVLPYILDPNFEKYLPIIPSEYKPLSMRFLYQKYSIHFRSPGWWGFFLIIKVVYVMESNLQAGYVNLTWKSGTKKYYYNFDRLQSFNEDVLASPVISIKTKGRVPRRPKVFSVLLPCNGNRSGIAAFSIGLLIETRKGKPLPGTPLRLRLRKECAERGPDPECDKKCANGGWCNKDKICQCQEGYLGPYCKAALCYPQCMNNGNCTAPGVCSCPEGYQGRHCEGER